MKCRKEKSIWIKIPDSVTVIGKNAFRGCTSLQSVTIPDSVTEIGKSAFKDCTNLQSVVLPDSMTKVGKYGKFCKTEREAAEYIAQHKKENPDTKDEKDTAEHPENVNPMCKNCGKFGGECQGTTEKVWTGCVYKTPKN